MKNNKKRQIDEIENENVDEKIIIDKRKVNEAKRRKPNKEQSSDIKGQIIMQEFFSKPIG